MIAPLTLLLLAAALLTLLIAAGWDLKARIIPDRLVLAIMGIGLVLRLAQAGGASWISIAVAVLVFLPMSHLAARNIVGGGDAKMITAITFLFPPERVVLPLVMIALAGGVLSVGYLMAGQMLKSWSGARVPVHNQSGLLRTETARVIAGEPLPFAFAIFAGVACSIILEALPCISATSSSTFCSL